MAEQVAEKLEQFNVTRPFAKKLPPGDRGKSLLLKTNLNTLTITKDIPLYKYDIRMTATYKRGNGEMSKEKEITKQSHDDFPEQERKALSSSIYQKLIQDHKEYFGTGTVYDRASILFSLSQLKERTFNLPGDYVFTDGADSIRVVIKKANDEYQTSTNHLAKTVGSRNSEMDKTILEWLNIVLSQESFFSRKFVTYGKTSGKCYHYLYDPKAANMHDDLPVLDCGKYTGIGATKTIKIGEGMDGKVTALVATDVTKGAFHNDSEPLLKKVEKFPFIKIPLQNIKDTDEFIRMKLKEQLKDLYVITTYKRSNGKTSRPMKISDIGESCEKIKFQVEKKGTMSAKDYYQYKYGTKLHYPNLPTVVVLSGGQKSHYPIELLEVAINQRVTQAQESSEDKAKMIKLNATLPAKRLDQTIRLGKEMGLMTKNPYLEKAGISISSDTVNVKGRHLDSIIIKYANKTFVAEKHTWNPMGAKFLKVAPRVQDSSFKWAVVIMLNQNDRGYVRQYIERLIKQAEIRGLRLPNPDYRVIDRASARAIEDEFIKAKNEKIGLLFFLSADSTTLHNHVKLYETLYGIISQDIKGNKAAQTVFKNQTQTLDNVVSKLNVKLGGVNYSVQLKTANPNDDLFINQKTRIRMTVGFEFSHPPSQGNNSSGYSSPSVIGWAANISSDIQDYKGDYQYIKPNDSSCLEKTLQDMIVVILRKYRNATQTVPTQILMYLSGISEGQWSKVCNEYYDAFNRGFKSLKAEYKPLLTIIVTSKDHSERIYKQMIMGNSAPEQNIPSGTVVDSTIVLPNVTQFYLNAHGTIQGTAKTPKYTVLVKELNISLNEIELVTYALCHLHEIISATVSIPAPLLIADRCAKRAADIFKAAYNDHKEITEERLEEANRTLVVLHDTRFNA